MHGIPQDEECEHIIKEDEDHDYSGHPCSQNSVVTLSDNSIPRCDSQEGSPSVIEQIHRTFLHHAVYHSMIIVYRTLIYYIMFLYTFNDNRNIKSVYM